MIMDIDRLNAINIAFSIDAGDFVIKECAKKLQEWNVSHNALLARMGDDEFGIHLCGDFNNDKLISVCEELQATMHEPIYYNHDKIDLTVSIGVVVLYRSMGVSSVMVQNAEMALDYAKSQGYGQYYLLDSKMYESARHGSRVEMLLRQSQTEKDFELYYQPQFSLPDRALVGAEALIRWKNTELGYIPPSIFIPIAEQTGMIHRLGKWVFQESIQQAIKWNRGSSRVLRVGINISPVQLTDDTFCATVAQLLKDSGVNPDWLELEITESVMLQQNDSIYKAFLRLRELGLNIAIDDFGAGHASFGYLSSFPFHKVKIDKLLIDNMAFNDMTGTHIVKSIIDMSRMIGIQTIAEGVGKRGTVSPAGAIGLQRNSGFCAGTSSTIRWF